jgi:hypothetical protein
MPRAVLKNGVIHPLEPLPPEWADGKELMVEAASIDEDDVHDPVRDAEFADRWFNEMERLCADSTPEEEAALQAALDEIRRQGKELMRKEMGLSE